MTQLTNLSIQSSFGDLLTTTNNTNGLSTTLENVQDGFGNNSTVQIATNAINFNRTGGNSFQLDGVSLIATATNINSVCKLNPILPGTGGVELPSGTTGQRPNPATDGTLRFNTSSNVVEYSFANNWISSTGTVTGPNSSVDGNIATFSGTTGSVIQDSGARIDTIPLPRPLGLLQSHLRGNVMAPQVDVLQLSNIGVLAFDNELATSGIGNIVVGTEQILNLFVQAGTFLRNAVFTDGVNTAPTSFSALVELSSTTGALLLSRMTTTERNALSATDGMILYNITTNAFDGYQNGAWSENIGGGAPTNASYILQNADATLPNAQSLGTLTTGILKNTVGGITGTLSTAIPGTDYYSPGNPTTIIDSRGGNDNFAIGNNSGNNNGQYFNTFVGLNVAPSSSSINNTGMGYQALSSLTSGSPSTAYGYRALFSLTTGHANVSVGDLTLSTLTGGSGNTAIGSSAGSSFAMYNDCTFIGADSDASASGLGNACAIGANAVISVNNAISLGSGCYVGIGNNSPAYTLDLGNITNQCAIRFASSTSTPNNPSSGAGVLYVNSGNLFFLNSSGVSTNILTPNNATYIVQTANSLLPSAQSLGALTTGLLKNTVTSGTGVLSTAVAGTDYYSAGHPTTIIDSANTRNNLCLGNTTGNNAGTSNTFIGLNSGQAATINSALNVSLGYSALVNLTSGQNNVGLGANCLLNLSSGSSNVSVGAQSLTKISTGSANSAFGFLAGSNFANYTSCTFIGADADCSVDSLTNATAIGAGALVGASNSICLGNGCFVGIGTTTPHYTLDVGNISNSAGVRLQDSNINPPTPSSGGTVLFSNSGELWAMHPDGSTTEITSWFNTPSGGIVQILDSLNLLGSTTLGSLSYVYYANIGNAPAFAFTSSTSGPYALQTTFRILAAEFDATSSKKIKNIICESPKIEDELTDEFLNIPFFKYRYKDEARDGKGDCYGVIAEYLADFYPQYVDDSQKQYIPNFLKLGKSSKYGDEKSIYVIEMESETPNFEESKLQLILETDERIDVEILESFDKSIKVKSERALPHNVFLYGTYESCPVVSKQKLFEIGLIVLQGLIKKLRNKGVL